MQSPKTSLSFFAAAFFANICSKGIKFWTIPSIDFETILNELVSSFYKFLPYLKENFKFRHYIIFKTFLNTVKHSFKLGNA
jgi:hypothetical protein